MQSKEKMAKDFALTFDIDWAPDYTIFKCLDIIEDAGYKSTFFATHRTPANNEIVARGHYLGIYPNFLSSSSQGAVVKEIISECFNFAPDAWCMRTHALVQSSPLLHEIFANYPQLKLDVSLFMHLSPFEHKVRWEWEEVSFDRLLYNLADYAHFPAYNEDIMPNMFFGKLTAFDFYPIHVFLNSTDGREYRKLKKEQSSSPLFAIDYEIAKKYIHKSRGTQSHLRQVLSSDNNCVSLDEI